MNDNRTPYMKSYFKQNKYYITNKNKILNYEQKLIKDKSKNPQEKLEKFISVLLAKNKYTPVEYEHLKKEKKTIIITFD